MFGYDSVGDMFDGGGAGRSGSTFSGGGPISSISNMVATPRGSRGSEGQMRPQGRPDMQRMAAGQSQKPNFLQDMFNGGGMGASGDKFQGAGGYSGLLNLFGVKPAGAQDRGTMQSYMEALQAASQPAMQPQAPYSPQTQPQPSSGLATEPNYADRFALPPQYSGRGDVGMPTQGPNYADRFALPEQPQYSGRGSAGMPYPTWAAGDPKMTDLVDYLLSRGVSGY